MTNIYINLKKNSSNKEKVLKISAEIYALEKEIADRERLYRIGLKNDLPQDELAKLNKEIVDFKWQQYSVKNIKSVR